MYRGETPLASAEDAQALRLQDEITALETRLRDMGEDGDCAYERAISRLYTDMVAERKRDLAALAAVLPR